MLVLSSNRLQKYAIYLKHANKMWKKLRENENSAHSERQTIQLFLGKTQFSDEKVNVSSTKSTNPGKGTTKAGKQTTRSER